MNSIGGGILALLIALVLFAPRRWALLGMMAGVLYLTQQQAIDLLGLNLTAIRLLELVAFVRVLGRREFSFSRFNGIDRALLLVYGYTTFVFLMRSDSHHVEMVGAMVDATLCYFTFRGLVRDMEELKWLLRAFVIILVPYVMLLSLETLTVKNPFTSMGALTWADLRDGRIRAMGSFRHPSLLGTLGASLLPLYIGLVLARCDRIRALAGIGLCFGIIFLSNSGGPLNAAAMGVVGWLCWAARMKMCIVRRILVGMIVFLVLVMKAPIWYLIARLSSLSGGTGWHRARLIDVAFTNLDQWWLAGMEIERTKDWLPYALGITGGADITNNFLAFGLHAGLLAMGLLIVLLIRTFRTLGHALAIVRCASTSKETEYLLWGLGCVLLVHVVTWFGITYFDQIYVVWFMQLAAISSISHTFITDKTGDVRAKGLIRERTAGRDKRRVLTEVRES
jgi:hypothetical protein